MISKEAFVTYAQYREDVILAALFADTKKGFYIDVGANYPTIDSVTKYFYDRGWNGINIEPLATLYEQLEHERPKDINLKVGIADKKGTLKFREYTDVPGHSTFTPKEKEAQKQGKFLDYSVDVLTLEEVFTQQKVKTINFLKVDVEGYEYQVLKGNNWKVYRPQVICIEANHIDKDWRPLLLKNQYDLFIKDGLNEYYIASEAQRLTKGFVERVVKLDYYALKQHYMQSWVKDVEDLNHNIEVGMQLRQENAQLVARISELSQYSLKGVGFARRLKRAIYGLTVDYYRYFKSKD